MKNEPHPLEAGHAREKIATPPLARMARRTKIKSRAESVGACHARDGIPDVLLAGMARSYEKRKCGGEDDNVAGRKSRACSKSLPG